MFHMKQSVELELTFPMRRSIQVKYPSIKDPYFEAMICFEIRAFLFSVKCHTRCPCIRIESPLKVPIVRLAITVPNPPILRIKT